MLRLGKWMPELLDRGLDAVLGLLHRGVGQADDGERGQAEGDVGLDRTR